MQSETPAASVNQGFGGAIVMGRHPQFRRRQSPRGVGGWRPLGVPDDDNDPPPSAAAVAVPVEYGWLAA